MLRGRVRLSCATLTATGCGSAHRRNDHRPQRGREAVLVAERVRAREIDDDEGQRLLRIIRRGSGSVVTWRRAQMVLLSAQGMPVA